MKKTYRRFRFFALCALWMGLAFSAMAQRERNYIYLFDCTKSMTGYNGASNVWQDAKDWLRENIAQLSPQTQLTLIPFQGTVLPVESALAKDFSWDKTEKKLDDYVQHVTNTNICDSWAEGCKYINPHKDNYLILLTDGQDNVKGSAALAEMLRQFCGKYPNTHAFYVVLNEKAVDPLTRDVVDMCTETHFVNLSDKITPFGCFDNDIVIYTNTLRLPSRHDDLIFSSLGTYKARAVCKDENFDISVVGGAIRDGRVPVEVKARKPISELNKSLPEQYEFTFDVEAEGVEILNPTVSVVVINKPERTFTILPEAKEEIDLGKATAYKRFLFWGAKKPDTLQVSLKDFFNEEARKDGSRVEFAIIDKDGHNDFDLLLNGNPVSDGHIRFEADAKDDVLSIVFHPDAQTGKRYLQILPKAKHELEAINTKPADGYQMSLRATYKQRMNPLKVLLLWLLAFVIVGLLLWFAVLKHYFFPTIKIGSLMITDPYYANLRTKGAWRVVFSAKRQQQGWLSRLFKGRIIYSTNPIWQTPLTLEASGKKLRTVSNQAYVFDPYAVLLTPTTEYTIEVVDTHEKIQMIVN